MQFTIRSQAMQQVIKYVNKIMVIDKIVERVRKLRTKSWAMRFRTFMCLMRFPNSEGTEEILSTFYQLCTYFYLFYARKHSTAAEHSSRVQTTVNFQYICRSEYQMETIKTMHRL